MPYFDYLWGNYYRDDILKGAIEGEFHFRHHAKGRIPHWRRGKVNRRELHYLSGYGLTQQDAAPAARALTKRFEKLRAEFATARRPNRELMFELGYGLHAIANSLVPRTTSPGMPSPEPCARNTAAIELKQSEIERIEKLRPWLVRRIEHHLQLRDQWETASDKDAFKQHSVRASQAIIYSLAAIMTYVMGTAFGPEDEKVRSSLEEMKNRRLGDGRKPDIE